jgi:hypothetical protein
MDSSAAWYELYAARHEVLTFFTVRGRTRIGPDHALDARDLHLSGV